MTVFLDGPRMLAAAATTDGTSHDHVLSRAFAPGDMTRMSAGHRAVAEANSAELAGLLNYFLMADDGPSVQAILDATEAGVNGKVLPNYSPAAYYINALMNESDRQFDYVGTIVFTD